MISLQVPGGKQAYFISDLHLGFPDAISSRAREKIIIAWLDSIGEHCSDLFLLGDLFDFWFEYAKAVPKGYVRFLGTLASMADRGVRLHIFVGNHDLWMKDYFPNELGALVYFEPTAFEFHCEGQDVKRLCLGHGDGIGPGDYGYKVLKKVFMNPLAQFAFRFLHPDIGIRLAHFWSNTRKSGTIQAGEVPFDPASDFILSYVRSRNLLDVAKGNFMDGYVFGHRHHPIVLGLESGASYYNLGDWFTPDFKNAYILSLGASGIAFSEFDATLFN